MIHAFTDRRRTQPVHWITLLAVLAALATCASELLAIRRARIEARADEQRIEQMLVREENQLKAIEIENTAILAARPVIERRRPPSESQPHAGERHAP